MVKMRYGLQGQVSFSDLNEYYYTLGFLANTRNAEIRWENNEESGAWGSEGRIHCLVPEECFPQCFRFTAGLGSVYARINCNEYVSTLVTEHHFNYNSSHQNIEKILETVPEKYRDAFKNGYGVVIDIDPVYKPFVRTSNKTSGSSGRDQKKRDPSGSDVRTKDIVFHKKWGKGVVFKIANGFIQVKFSGEIKQFMYPDAFKKGFLTFEQQ